MERAERAQQELVTVMMREYRLEEGGKNVDNRAERVGSRWLRDGSLRNVQFSAESADEVGAESLNA